jgi:type I restriction enzyme S subunit
LPPLDQQRRIADILRVADEALQKQRDLSAAVRPFEQMSLDKIFDTDHETIGAKTLDDFAVKIVDGVHRTPNYIREGVPFIVIENLNRGPGIDFTKTRFVSDSDHAEFSRRANPERGDVLVSKDGTLGVARYVDTDRPFSIFVSVALIKPDRRVLDGRFLTWYIRSKVFWEHVKRTSAGSALKHIHLRDFKSAPFPNFSLSEQTYHVERLQKVEILACRADEHVSTLQDLLRALIDELI